MCDPVIGASVMAGSQAMSLAGQKATAEAQYEYGMQTTSTQRKWNKMFEAVNRKNALSAWHDTLAGIQKSGMQASKQIVKRANKQVNELDKITSKEKLSAQESNVIADMSDNARKRGELEVELMEAEATNRNNIEVAVNDAQAQTISRINSGIQPPIIDPIRPDTGWGIADVFSIGQAGASGYSMFMT